jgi:hypothetical protein
MELIIGELALKYPLVIPKKNSVQVFKLGKALHQGFYPPPAVPKKISTLVKKPYG